MHIVVEDKIRFKRSEQLHANFGKFTKYCFVVLLSFRINNFGMN